MNAIAAMAVALIGVLSGSAAGWAQAAEQPAPSRLERVLAAKELRVCIWPAYYSITFRNPRTGSLEGIDVDLARELGHDLGVAVTSIDSSFATFMDDLEADICDIAMFGVGVTPARRKRVDFTEPYLNSGIVAVTASVNDKIRSWEDIDRPGLIVAAQSGTYMVDVMRGMLRHAQLMEISAPNTREAEVEAGRADVFISDYPYTRRVLTQNHWARLIEPASPVHPTPYAHAVKKGDAAWLTRINQFIRTVKADGRLAATAHRHNLQAIFLRD